MRLVFACERGCLAGSPPGCKRVGGEAAQVGTPPAGDCAGMTVQYACPSPEIQSSLLLLGVCRIQQSSLTRLFVVDVHALVSLEKAVLVQATTHLNHHSAPNGWTIRISDTFFCSGDCLLGALEAGKFTFCHSSLTAAFGGCGKGGSLAE